MARLAWLSIADAATFGWLCVETSNTPLRMLEKLAATFGWLCVETSDKSRPGSNTTRSHLRVAVC